MDVTAEIQNTQKRPPASASNNGRIDGASARVCVCARARARARSRERVLL
jgi:hypothetical protein